MSSLAVDIWGGEYVSKGGMQLYFVSQIHLTVIDDKETSKSLPQKRICNWMKLFTYGKADRSSRGKSDSSSKGQRRPKA